MLKDRGSWSYDWRIPLEVLERCHKQGGNKATASSSILRLPQGIPAPRNTRADQIKPPSIWSISSFYAYVVQLASSRVDRLVSRRIYSEGETHTSAVTDILAKLFADPALKYMVSSDAGNIALKFLFEKGKFARGQDIFCQLQELQKDDDPTTYNIMLGAAAEQRDLYNFIYVLKMMVARRVCPDTTTWLHLARTVSVDEVRALIIRMMTEKGLLADCSAHEKAVALLMPQVVKKSLRSGEPAQEFLAALDDQHGPRWCSTAAAEPIIDEIGIRHSTQEALVFLRKLHDRGYQPTQGMLLLLLRQCTWTKAHQLAVEILALFRTDYKVKPSKQIYDVLFKQAWRSRLYNCCRVLWIYACVSGHTSFDMQQMVKKSLTARKGKPATVQTRSGIWEETAGKVITDHARQNTIGTFQASMSLWKPLEANSETSQNDRDRYLQAVRLILDRDLAIVGQYQLPKALDEEFHRALKADRQWALSRALRDIPIECKYSQIINVPLVPKTQSRNLDDPAEPAQPAVDAIGPGLSDEKRPDTSGRCWMSSEMRFRPCICPAYVKERLPSVTAVDEHQGHETSPDALSLSCKEKL